MTFERSMVVEKSMKRKEFIAVFTPYEKMTSQRHLSSFAAETPLLRASFESASCSETPSVVVSPPAAVAQINSKVGDCTHPPIQSYPPEQVLKAAPNAEQNHTAHAVQDGWTAGKGEHSSLASIVSRRTAERPTSQTITTHD